MQIKIIAHGTRGDVQPAIALGKALQTRGHAARLAVSANFARWVEDHGLEAAGSTADIQAMMESDGGQAWIEHGTNTGQFHRGERRARGVFLCKRSGLSDLRGLRGRSGFLQCTES